MQVKDSGLQYQIRSVDAHFTLMTFIKVWHVGQMIQDFAL
jgi:hypothetical protein